MPAAVSSELVSLLGALPLFHGVAVADLQALAAQCRVDAFEKEAAIFLQGDPTERIFLVKSGQVKIVFQDDDGRDMILEIIPPGEAFGGAVLFFPAHPATAKAMEPSEIVSFPSQRYAEFLMSQPAVAVRVLRMLGQRHFGMLRMQALAGERTERRIAHILLKLASRVGQPDPEGTLITLSLSRQDIAEMAGTTLETAIRKCSRFSARGLIRTRAGGHIVILNADGLHQLAQPGKE